MESDEDFSFMEMEHGTGGKKSVLTHSPAALLEWLSLPLLLSDRYGLCNTKCVEKEEKNQTGNRYSNSQSLIRPTYSRVKKGCQERLIGDVFGSECGTFRTR